MKLLKITLAFFSLSFLVFACVEEPKEKEKVLDPTTLLGRWELTQATVDKVASPRLEGAYLEFEKEGVMTTNIMGSEEKGSYEMLPAERKLTQKTAKTVNYNIEKLVNDSLILNMEINRKKYRVTLEKEREM